MPGLRAGTIAAASVQGGTRMHDIGFNPPPASGALAQVTGSLFKAWMKACNGGLTIDDQNPFQIVAYLAQGTTFTTTGEKTGTQQITPNWHLTMMSGKDDRNSSKSKNFHFKIEVGKASSHYWHYVLYRDAATQSWHWVGDQTPGYGTHVTNQGGGGAAGDVLKLAENLTIAQVQARAHGLDGKMSKKIQNKLTAVLSKWDKAGRLRHVAELDAWNGK
jgi:hypothetical protein